MMMMKSREEKTLRRISPGFHDYVIIKKIDAYCPSSILPDFFSQLAANAKNEKDNFDDDNTNLRT